MTIKGTNDYYLKGNEIKSIAHGTANGASTRTDAEMSGGTVVPAGSLPAPLQPRYQQMINPGHVTGARPASDRTAAPSGTPEMGPNETRLRETLRGRGLNDGEIDAYMTRFPADGPGRAHSTRETQIGQYLPPNRGPDRRDAAHKPEAMDAPALRTNVRDGLRDQALKNMREARPPITDQQAYDYLSSHGLIDPARTPRPATASPLGRDTGSNWATREINPQEARDLASNPIFTRSPGTVTSNGLTADIQRHRYVDAARQRYVEWAQRPRDANPNPGLGLNAEQANARFNERAEQLGLVSRNQDGSYSVKNDWNPNDTRPDSPAQSFFRNNTNAGQAIRYEPDGSLRAEDAATFRHENPNSTSPDPANPVHQAALRGASQRAGRDTLYASLTGEAPAGSNMRVIHEGEGESRRYFLEDTTRPSGPDNRREIRVVHPPLTRDQALAYMQSASLTDAEGNPLPGVSGDTLTARLGEIQTGDSGRARILGQARDWERSQIAGILSQPPHNKSPQEITRFMHSRGWLGENADPGQMEDFRRQASPTRATAGSAEARSISDQIARANTPANEPQSQTERDRAADIRDTLNTARRTDADRNASENRAGRQTTRNEGDRNRENALEIEQRRIDSQEREGRANRENQRVLQREQLDHQAREARLQREHDSAEREKDRGNQMLLGLIQFMGSIIGAAMQAMSSTASASIQGSQQLSGQIIAGMRQR